MNMASPNSATKATDLHSNYLSFPETIAQSFANIAPTITPALAIPLVAMNAGNGTWLVYLVSMIGLALVGRNVSVFAKRLATPGALYRYVSEGLGTPLGFIAGWSMLAAYLGTAMATLVGFGIFTQILLADVGVHLPILLWEVTGLGLIWFLAFKDIRLSAVMALIMEFSSISFIVAIGAIIMVSHGFHLDTAQLSLRHVKISGLALGMVLTVFSYVGFESAATLGRESKNPHQAIPRSVVVSLTIAGIFFITLAYIEILGFPGGLAALDKSSAPLNQMASYYHVPWFAPLTDLGAMVSLFSCTLASLNAGSRILYSMGQDRHFHRQLGRAHHRNRTPHVAVTTSAATVLIAVISLAGSTPLNAYGYFGTYATYGFILVYMLIAIAAPVYLRKTGELRLRDVMVGGTAFAFMLMPLIGSVFPIPAFPYDILPYAFIAYLAAGYIWYYMRTKSPHYRAVPLTEQALAQKD